MHKVKKVRELISYLGQCDQDSDIYATFNKDALCPRALFIAGIDFDDDDSEEAKEIGRKNYGTDYLRIPVLIIEENS